MYLLLHTVTWNLNFIIVSMVTEVQGHIPNPQSDSVQDGMSIDEMQVSFVHGSSELKRVFTQDELVDISVEWDQNATDNPWKLVSDRYFLFEII